MIYEIWELTCTYFKIHLLSSVSMNPDSRRRSNCKVTRSVQKEFFCNAIPYPLRPNVSPEITKLQSRLASYSSLGESQKKTFILPWPSEKKKQKDENQTFDRNMNKTSISDSRLLDCFLLGKQLKTKSSSSWSPIVDAKKS